MSLELLWLVPALPLLGAILNGIGAGKLPRKLVSLIGVGSVGGAFAIALGCFQGLLALPAEERFFVQTLFSWIDSGDLSVAARLGLDPLSAVMMLVVTGVGFLIHVYSTGYMSHEKAYGRYFSYHPLAWTGFANCTAIQPGALEFAGTVNGRLLAAESSGVFIQCPNEGAVSLYVRVRGAR